MSTKFAGTAKRGTAKSQFSMHGIKLMLCGAWLFAAVLIAGILPSHAWASNSALPSGTSAIPVKQEFSQKGLIPDNFNDSFEYELLSSDGIAPLPDGATGIYTFSVHGTNSYQIPLVADGSSVVGGISYSKTGNYEYDLRCVTDASSVEGLSVDDTTWHINVAVINGDNGDLLIGWVKIQEQHNIDPNGDKAEDAHFTHSFVGKPIPKPQPKPHKNRKLKLAQTGDTNIGLIQLTAGIALVGVVVVGASLYSKRKQIRHDK